MDRSYNTSLLNAKSPFSPRSRQNISISSTKRQLIPASFRKSSRFSVSGKSNQSVQVILKSTNHYVERFGQPLPVLVTEALTFAERSTVVSARISECGFAWVVCGRRLLIWQYRQNQTQYSTPQKKHVSSQCYELQLPQSDLAHRAELVSVFMSSGSHAPSCIAVSPEGVVRYWPAVTHEGLSIEQGVSLQGQECDSLTDIGSLGCILATTTCSVVLVQPSSTAGRPNLSCHTLRTPTGWLGGISRRMSSFIFGPMSTEQSAETRLVRVLSVQDNENNWIVYVVAGHSLQKWKISNEEPEQLMYLMELNRSVRDGFHSTVWENCGGDHNETDTWLLDIQINKNDIMILAAAVNLHVSPQVYYALVTVNANTIQAPTNITDFVVLKLTGLYREDRPADSLSYRFLLCGSCAYLYNQRGITIIKPQEEVDTLEFITAQDLLLGGAICVNSPVFFSRNHGLVVVSSNDMGPDLNASALSQSVAAQLESSINESVIGNLSLYNMDAEEIYHAIQDTVGQLKAAFIFHIKNQQASCQEIIQELFLSDGIAIPGIDASLDKVVLAICQELLNDIPASDPRWTIESTSLGLGSSYSMQVLNQLQDKHRAYNLFLRFLHDTNLWTQLAAITVRDNVMATVHVLGELSEEVVAAIALKNSNNSILEKAIERVVQDSDVPIENGLSKQDMFYREVTKVYRVIQEIVNRCEEVIHSELNSNEVAVLIKESNELILSVLKEVMQYRQRSVDNFIPNPNVLSLVPDYLPWTAASGAEGLSDCIMLQQTLTCNYGARTAGDNFLKNALYDQMMDLIDILLDGQKSHLESIKGSNREEILLKQYQADRHKLIAPFVIDKKWERAALLAEKYLDFETLVIMCDSTNNQQRLDEYMDRFNNVGFSEFVCTWYLQKNQPGKLISRCRTTKKSKNTQNLTNFLAGHPSLSWLQNIFDKKFDNAAMVLKDLAENETDLVTRQKTIYSLSKLAKLASTEEDDDFIRHTNCQLELIAFQEDIPDYVLQHYGYDTMKLKVIPPKDLVYLYTCDEYKEATELDFKKALDIAEYVNDEELCNELRLKVWRIAILRDNWLEGNVDSPIETLQKTMFFKVADVAICLGADPQNILPPLDILMECSELADLQESKNFQYLMKTGYEHISKLQAME